ncbi:YceI family protein [Polaribacter ponticola]|uniref:YceI family protein n=1 Tax=Polaribacter ponticola TaxID=2978475 RepID=A0ABT5SCF6_9FLAO|nr:YceI family protein [Polaribacter sp. MSW5]MDD7914957.1 YceI family protein [Polaribacter sp. MSW5]
MKKVIVTLILVASVLTACKGEKKEKVEVKEAVKVETNIAELNNVDLATSILNWKGTKPGGAHNGIVTLKSGGLLIENETLKGGQFIIDMNSITNLDMKGSKGAENIEGHLKNEDFFDVAVYPVSKFVITNVENTEGKLFVTGNLNIKDVTKSVTIPASLTVVNGVSVFKSESFNINRADFNIKYKSKSFFKDLKDKFVDDLVEMSFVVKTKA